MDEIPRPELIERGKTDGLYACAAELRDISDMLLNIFTELENIKQLYAEQMERIDP